MARSHSRNLVALVLKGFPSRTGDILQYEASVQSVAPITYYAKNKTQEKPVYAFMCTVAKWYICHVNITRILLCNYNLTRLLYAICSCKKHDKPTLALFVLIVSVSGGLKVLCNYHMQSCKNTSGYLHWGSSLFLRTKWPPQLERITAKIASDIQRWWIEWNLMSKVGLSVLFSLKKR